MDDKGNSLDSVQNELGDTRLENAVIAENPDEVLDVYEIARFWSRIEVRQIDQCWPWRWDSRSDGYADYRFSNGEREGAHRVAYRIGRGKIAGGLIVRHGCDNPLCCNPTHLVTGTHADNVADRVERERSARGEGSGRARLTEKQVRLIRGSMLSNEYWSHKFDVDRTTIAAARSGKTWAHIT